LLHVSALNYKEIERFTGNPFRMDQPTGYKTPAIGLQLSGSSLHTDCIIT